MAVTPKLIVARRKSSATMSSHAAVPRVYGVRVLPNGDHYDFDENRLDFVSKFGLPPRDLRLLVHRGGHIAVRPSYFLFNFPPFLAGLVSSDEAVLIINQEALDEEEGGVSQQEAARLATRVLQECISMSVKQVDLPFEHVVLETVLREDGLRKQERFARLALLTRRMLALRDQPDQRFRGSGLGLVSLGADRVSESREQAHHFLCSVRQRD